MPEKTTKKGANFHYIPERHRVGAILRTTDNMNRLQLLSNAINALLNIPSISLIHIIIASDKERSALRDELIKIFGSEKKRLLILDVKIKDFYADTLNHAIHEQVRLGVDYSFIISAEAFEYITQKNIGKMLSAAKDGAFAIGLIIQEYKDIIKKGYLSNAFCLYKNTLTNFANVWKINAIVKNTDIEEKQFGMEELYVIKNLLDNYNKGSIAIVEPDDIGKLVEIDDEKARELREKVKKTKEERFEEMCRILQIDTEKLKENIRYIK